MAAKRKQAQRRGTASGGVPGWLWMLGGFMPGLFLAALVHLHHERQAQIQTTEPDARQTTAAAESAEDGDQQRPRFEFYQLLSEMEVVVPDEEPATPDETTTARIEAPVVPPESSAGAPSRPATGAREEPEAPAAERDAPSAPAGGEAVRYMVQAGSFRSHDDADRLRARLALLGVEANIQSVDTGGGETWHRVRIGPMEDRRRVEDVRRRLQEEQVDSILLRLQG